MTSTLLKNVGRWSMAVVFLTVAAACSPEPEIEEEVEPGVYEEEVEEGIGIEEEEGLGVEEELEIEEEGLGED